MIDGPGGVSISHDPNQRLTKEQAHALFEQMKTRFANGTFQLMLIPCSLTGKQVAISCRCGSSSNVVEGTYLKFA